MKKIWLVAVTFGVGGVFGTGITWLVTGQPDALTPPGLPAEHSSGVLRHRGATIPSDTQKGLPKEHVEPAIPLQNTMTLPALTPPALTPADDDALGESLAVALARLEKRYRALQDDLELQWERKWQATVQAQRDSETPVGKEPSTTESSEQGGTVSQIALAVSESVQPAVNSATPSEHSDAESSGSDAIVNVDAHVESTQTNQIVVNHFASYVVAAASQTSVARGTKDLGVSSKQLSDPSHARQLGFGTYSVAQNGISIAAPTSPWAPIDMSKHNNPWAPIDMSKHNDPWNPQRAP